MLRMNMKDIILEFILRRLNFNWKVRKTVTSCSRSVWLQLSFCFILVAFSHPCLQPPGLTNDTGEVQVISNRSNATQGLILKVHNFSLFHNTSQACSSLFALALWMRNSIYFDDWLIQSHVSKIFPQVQTFCLFDFTWVLHYVCRSFVFHASCSYH